RLASGSRTTITSHGWRFVLLPDQRPTSRMSAITSCDTGSGVNAFTDRNRRRNSIRPFAASIMRLPRLLPLPHHGLGVACRVHVVLADHQHLIESSELARRSTLTGEPQSEGRLHARA